MKIRPLQIEDYESVYRLWLNTPGMGLNTEDDSKEGIRKYLRRNPNTCFVAEHNKEIAGVILAGHDGRRGYIYHTAVDAAQRNQGIGSALVDHVMEALKKEGIHKVALVVFSQNNTGNSFWEKRGFIQRNDLIYRNKNIDICSRIDT